METVAVVADGVSDAVAFLAHLLRLQREVAELSREVERLEREMQQAVNQFEQKRFEEYR